MAINNTTGSFPFMEFPMAFSRQDSFPSPLAYVGQVLSVVVDGVATIYQIKNAAGDLEALGTGDLEGDVASVINAKTASTENINEMIGEVYGADNEAEG